MEHRIGFKQIMGGLKGKFFFCVSPILALIPKLLNLKP